jgi:hypothetical protein
MLYSRCKYTVQFNASIKRIQFSKILCREKIESHYFIIEKIRLNNVITYYKEIFQDMGNLPWDKK